MAVLAPHLDIDGVLEFLALEMVFVNTDGYWTRASDYSLFENEQGRFHVLPYEFQRSDGRGRSRPPGVASADTPPLIDAEVKLDGPKLYG